MIAGIVSSQASSAAASIIIPGIGEPFGGGFYAGTISYGGDNFLLVLAPKSSEQYGKKWKTTNTVSVGTSSTQDGYANTLAMVGVEHEAGEVCREYSNGGFSDWYLPAIDELTVITTNLNPIGAGTPTAFLSGGAEAFQSGAEHYYWSSTEATSSGFGIAWTKTPATGTNTMWDKSFPLVYLRPIRRIAYAP